MEIKYPRNIRKMKFDKKKAPSILLEDQFLKEKLTLEPCAKCQVRVDSALLVRMLGQNTFDFSRIIEKKLSSMEEKRNVPPWNRKMNSNLPKAGSKKQKVIPKDKLDAFSTGIVKKTAFQKAKEEAENKKKKESEEAAKVYADFVASFDHNPIQPKMFVKGETVQPQVMFNKASAPSTDNSADPSRLYQPQPKIDLNELANIEEPENVKTDSKSKKRNLDLFLEEIKREQEEREERLKPKQARIEPDNNGENYLLSATIKTGYTFDDQIGSHDTGDMTTTNLYVGNINPLVNEEVLCKEFGMFGPIASVKIMWPRSQEEKDRNRNCGFVSYMKREDAEKALNGMDGKEVSGYAMRVGWGKPVALPEKPFFVLNPTTSSSGLPFNAQLPNSKDQNSSKINIPLAFSIRPQVLVKIPKDPLILAIIHRTIERVIKHGFPFEQAIMKREARNSRFEFLFKNDSSHHVYYRWKLHSLLQGDSKSKWRMEAFEMFDIGPIWVPPEVPFEDHNQNGDEPPFSSDEDLRERTSQNQSNNKGNRLSWRAKYKIEYLLRNMTTKRDSIAQCMAFAIDHADCAEEVVEVIIKSLVLPETRLNIKLGRLYVVSDVLHNSGQPIPNVWKYRSLFEGKLIGIFEHLGEFIKGTEASKIENWKEHILDMLDAWETWILFPQMFINQLRLLISNGGEEELDKEVVQENDGGAEDDLDGIPFDLKSINNSEQINQIQEDDDIDGIPMEIEEGGGTVNKTIPKEEISATDVSPGIEAGNENEDIDGEPIGISLQDRNSPQCDEKQSSFQESKESEESSGDVEDMFSL